MIDHFESFVITTFRRASLAVLFLAVPIAAAAQTETYEGFGAATPGGTGKPVYHVTNLNNAGPGSLRDACSLGNRNVVFDVGGDIVLSSEVTLRASFITVDALTAPSPGITLKNYGLIIRGTAGHDIIVRGMRIRDAHQDGIWVTDAAYNVVIDHVSVQNSGDGNIDITRVGTRDITVCWSILAEPAGEEKNMLLAFKQSRITLHHNLFIDASQRSPQVTFDDSTERAQDTDTTLDMRNNLIWNWRGGYGSRIRYGGQANVVDNFYSSDGGDGSDALIICKGLPVDSDCYNDVTNTARAYVSGNFSADGVNLNVRGTEATPFLSAHVATDEAHVAACQVRDGAGARPLDLIDQQYLSTISLSPCQVTPTPTPTNHTPTVTRTPTPRPSTPTFTPTNHTPTATRTPTPRPFTPTFTPTNHTPTATRTAGTPAPTSTRTPTPNRTPTRTPIGGGTGTFSDNFERDNSTSLGDLWLRISGNLVVDDRKLKNASGIGTHVALVKSLSGARQTVDVDFTSPDNNQGPRFGIVLRYQDPKNYYLIYRQVGGSSRLVISRFVNGVEKILASPSIGNPATKVPFHLTGRASGTTLSLDFNGVNKANVLNETTFTSGKVGILIGSNSKTTQYQADNFTASVQ
jgi:hypothetical protein